MSNAAGPLAEIEFSVPTMVCDGCAEKIRSALIALAGVYVVKPRLWRKRVRVRFDESKIDETRIRDALDDAGYTATPITYGA